MMISVPTEKGEAMDLISKEEILKKSVIMWDEAVGFKECVLVDEILKLLVTELTNCKDCAHWVDGVHGCTEHVKLCKIGYYMIGENGYCVYAERRTDDKRTG